MPAPIALQLYTVREQLAQDYAGTITKIAAMGYAGVEPAGYPGTTAKDAAQLFRSLGLTACSAHVALPIGAAAQRVIDEAATIGCRRVISGAGPDDFKTADTIKATCAKFNEAAANVAKAGLTFGVHNHWWEFGKLADGTPAYRVMLEHVDPRVFFELDVYWVQTAGCDPAAIVAEFGPRAPLLHLKDGPCQPGQPMTAVGDGTVNIPAVVKAAKANVEWLVVELDACATEMLAAVAKSCQYLVGKKLARGRKK